MALAESVPQGQETREGKVIMLLQWQRQRKGAS